MATDQFHITKDTKSTVWTIRFGDTLVQAAHMGKRLQSELTKALARAIINITKEQFKSGSDQFSTSLNIINAGITYNERISISSGDIILFVISNNIYFDFHLAVQFEHDDLPPFSGAMRALPPMSELVSDEVIIDLLCFSWARHNATRNIKKLMIIVCENYQNKLIVVIVQILFISPTERFACNTSFGNTICMHLNIGWHHQYYDHTYPILRLPWTGMSRFIERTK